MILTYSEIGRILDCSLSTVRILLDRHSIVRTRGTCEIEQKDLDKIKAYYNKQLKRTKAVAKRETKRKQIMLDKLREYDVNQLALLFYKVQSKQNSMMDYRLWLMSEV
jgi:hypothetical protein